jgi:hypothetical protein
MHSGFDEEPRLPREFDVEDILSAPLEAREPEGDEGARRPPSPRVAPEQEARAALWELDFALQELDWLQHGQVHEHAMIQSIVSQILYAVRNVSGFPVDDLPMPDDLNDELAERFGRLTEAIEDLPSEWADHEDVHAAHARLRSQLALRGVEVD